MHASQPEICVPFRFESKRGVTWEKRPLVCICSGGWTRRLVVGECGQRMREVGGEMVQMRRFRKDGEGDGDCGDDEVEHGEETPECESEDVRYEDLMGSFSFRLVPAHVEAGIVAVKSRTQSGDTWEVVVSSKWFGFIKIAYRYKARGKWGYRCKT
jgi:hypothetical protein